jgi:hypothetical protein
MRVLLVKALLLLTVPTIGVLTGPPYTPPALMPATAHK